MFHFSLASLGEIHVRPARERGVAVPRRLAVAHQYEFAGLRGSQQIARPRDREALLAVAFEQLVSIIFREGVLLVEEGRGPSEDVVDLQRVGGGEQQNEMHGSRWLLRGCRARFKTRWELIRRPRIAAFESWLALPASALAQPFKSVSRRTELALGSPERRVRACGAGPGRVFA